MVDEECRRYKPSKNYLEFLPTLNTAAFETDLMKNEFTRIESGQRIETMNTKRYELPTPPQGKLGEIQAWQESVDNSFAQLEHQSIRLLNLELMDKYGVETWKSALEIMVQMSARAQKQLQEIKKEIQDVNWNRKSKQLQTGEKLSQLNQQWVSLVSCNYEIERAVLNLENQIAMIQMKTQQHNGDESNGHSKVEENESKEDSEDVEMT
jgi:pre-mRNA-splicing factor SPF27